MPSKHYMSALSSLPAALDLLQREASAENA